MTIDRDISMINKDVCDGILFINKTNWKSTVGKLYGYRTCKQNGNWIETKWVSEDELKITSSFSSIPIMLYDDGQYWAISNSPATLVNHLKSIGKTLTPNYSSYLITTPVQNNPYSIHAYRPNDTYYYEITALRINTLVIIKNGNISLEVEPLDYFTIPLEESCKIIEEWIEDWRNYAVYSNSLDVFRAINLSGGLDSRLLFLMLKDYINLNKLQNRWTKNKGELNCYDGLIARCLAYDTENIKLLEKPSYDSMEKEIDFNRYLVFDWGNLISCKKFSKENKTCSNNPQYKFIFGGTGTECLKDATANNIDFLTGNCKRNFCTTDYRCYYYDHCAIISPFMDERLFQIRATTGKTLMFIMYLLLGVEEYLFKFPFITNQDPYFIKPDDPDFIKAKEIVTRYKEGK